MGKSYPTKNGLYWATARAPALTHITALTHLGVRSIDLRLADHAILETVLWIKMISNDSFERKNFMSQKILKPAPASEVPFAWGLDQPGCSFNPNPRSAQDMHARATSLARAEMEAADQASRQAA